MEFYVWRPAFWSHHFVGNTQKEVMDALNAYSHIKPIELPDSSSLYRNDTIRIVCTKAIANANIEARINDSLALSVDARLFDTVVAEVQKDENLRLKMGDLYRFLPTGEHTLAGDWFLPQNVLQAMKDYKWDQHTAEVNGYLSRIPKPIDPGRFFVGQSITSRG